MQGREQAIERIRHLLEQVGFLVTDAHGIRPTSFDLMARRDSQILILKILKNIDALAPEEGERLQVLGRLLCGAVLIIGRNSGSSELESGVVYSRYGVPILTEEALEEYLIHGVPPFLLSSPGGVFARIDGPRLRELREHRGLSLGALAGIAGVTRRTIQLYEEGGGAEVSIVERLEGFLHDTVARPIPILEESRPSGAPKRDPRRRAVRNPPTPTGDGLRDDVFQRLDTMGWNVVVTVRCPFDAFTEADTGDRAEILLTSVGSLRSARHRAEVLQGLARVLEGHSMFVTRDPTDRESIEGLPLVSIHELNRHRDRAELVELLNERERS